MIKKTTVTYEAAPTAIFSETFSFIFQEYSKRSREKCRGFLRCCAASPPTKPGKTLRYSCYNGSEDWNESGTQGSLKSPLCSFVSITAFDSCGRTESWIQHSRSHLEAKFRLTGSTHDPARNRLPDLSLGIQAQRRELQKLSSPTGAV
jgi:hypothetical protein